MNIKEAIKMACKEPTLVKAFTWIAVWESERIVKQAFRQERDIEGKGWDTCFGVLFELVNNQYN